MALTDDDKQRIRDEELTRLLVRDEYQTRKRQRNLMPIAIGGTCLVMAVLILAFSILRTV